MRAADALRRAKALIPEAAKGRKPRAYYNEIEPHAVAWMRKLIDAGMIPAGEVDSRPIQEVQPDDIRDFTQHHFFAGVAGWALAARFAGWPDGRQLFTGSCPCQPFSVAGKGKGASDARHLWPHLYRIMRGLQPAFAVGEQVAGAAGYAWLDGVQTDLEAEDYTCRAVDIPACSVGAPHIRNRLYWVAQRECVGLQARGDGASRSEGWSTLSGDGGESTFGMANSEGIPQRESQHEVGTVSWEDSQRDAGRNSARFDGLSDSSGAGLALGQERSDERRNVRGEGSAAGADGAGDEWLDYSHGDGSHSRSGAAASSRYGSPTLTGSWDDYSLAGPDPKGKYRRVGIDRESQQPIRLLAHGLPAGTRWAIPRLREFGIDAKTAQRIAALAKGNRIGNLRGYGNAIVPWLAAEVLIAWMETHPERLSA